jgi:hypothetical protein
MSIETQRTVAYLSARGRMALAAAAAAASSGQPLGCPAVPPRSPPAAAMPSSKPMGSRPGGFPEADQLHIGATPLGSWPPAPPPGAAGFLRNQQPLRGLPSPLPPPAGPFGHPSNPAAAMAMAAWGWAAAAGVDLPPLPIGFLGSNGGRGPFPAMPRGEAHEGPCGLPSLFPAAGGTAGGAEPALGGVGGRAAALAATIPGPPPPAPPPLISRNLWLGNVRGFHGAGSSTDCKGWFYMLRAAAPLAFVSSRQERQHRCPATPRAQVMIPNAEVLTSVFHPFGPIESVRVFTGRTYAFVNFMHEAHAAAAKASLEMQVRAAAHQSGWCGMRSACRAGSIAGRRRCPRCARAPCMRPALLHADQCSGIGQARHSCSPYHNQPHPKHSPPASITPLPRSFRSLRRRRRSSSASSSRQRATAHGSSSAWRPITALWAREISIFISSGRTCCLPSRARAGRRRVRGWVAAQPPSGSTIAVAGGCWWQRRAGSARRPACDRVQGLDLPGTEASVLNWHQ